MIFTSKAKVKAWKALMGSVVNLQDEIALDIKPDMIFSKNTMAGNVVLSMCRWTKDKFDEFNVEKETRIGIRLENINQILKRFADQDTLEVSYDNGTMFFKSGKKSYDMRCVNPSEPFEKEPSLRDDLQYVIFDTTYSELKDVMEDLVFLGDGFNISSSKGKIIFKTSDDSGKGSVELEKPVELVAETIMNIAFTQEILTSLGKLSDSIKCHFFQNGYMLLKFFVKELGEVDYYIAPRIEQKN